MDDVRTSYDRVAAEYTERIAGELVNKPFDRAYLDRLAEALRDRGPVWELGCGPGHVARYLYDRGVDIAGLDLSPEMIVHAQRLNPDMRFEAGDMLDLPMADASVAGLVAFYSIIHFDEVQLDQCFAEMHRVLRPGAPAAIAFHIGSETLHRDELWGQPVSFDFHFLEPDDIAERLDRVGLPIVERFERAPYPEVEFPSRRAYLTARRAP